MYSLQVEGEVALWLEPWPGTLRYVLGQNTLITLYSHSDSLHLEVYTSKLLNQSRYLASHREQESSKEESHDIRSERLKERDRQQYLEAGQTVKRMTREDKQANIRERASQAEDAANRRGQGQVYNITNLVSRKYHKATDTPIVDNQGRLLTMEA